MLAIGGLALANLQSGNWRIGVPARFWFSALFLVLGAGITLSGIKAFFDKMARRKRDSQHKDEAWLVDHPWDLQGAICDPGKQMCSRFGTAFGMGLFLIPFSIAAYADREAGFLVCAAAFGCGAMGMIAHGACLLAQRRKYGISRLRFLHCPFVLGGNLDVELLCERPIGRLESLKIELRCIQERLEQRGRHVAKVCYSVYRDRILVSKPGEEMETKPLPITFRLPESSVYRTRLSVPQPCYWELEITAQTHRVNYRVTFLVPVYSKAALTGTPA